jgi:hypothetical protein
MSRASSLSQQGSSTNPELSGGSFIALLRNMAQQREAPLLDKSEIVAGDAAAAGGVRVRLKHYFSRQKPAEPVA